MDDVKILEGTNLSFIKGLELEAKQEFNKIKYFILLYLGLVSLFLGLSVAQFGLLARGIVSYIGLLSSVTLTVPSIICVFRILKRKVIIRKTSNNEEGPLKLNFRTAGRRSIETKERTIDFNQLFLKNKSKQIKLRENGGGNGKRKS